MLMSSWITLGIMVTVVTAVSLGAGLWALVIKKRRESR